MLRKILPWWVALAALMVLAGCERQVRLMPTPAKFTRGEHSPFAATPAAEKTNLVDVFYATNRRPLGPRGARLYSIVPGRPLYFGRATVRIGDKDMSWDELYALSTTAAEGRRPLLRLDKLDEMAIIRDPQAQRAPTGEARDFFEAVDQAVAQSADKDLTIYVHGSNTNVAVAAAQAAQYRHFTGRNSVVLLFAWPSAERGIRYFTDVANARASVPAFARLLELLAGNTRARNIHIVAYSAGSQILSPALVELRRVHRNDALAGLRLGELYFAAPDLAFPAFARQLPRYIHFVRRVTVSANMNDAPLALSTFVHGISRLGRPDSSELSDADAEWLVQAAEKLDFDAISVRPEGIPGLGRRSHAFWYEHPWVSSDVMLKLRFHVPPAARGLEQNLYQGRFPFWTFPPDYGRRVVEILRDLQAQQPANRRGGDAGTEPAGVKTGD